MKRSFLALLLLVLLLPGKAQKTFHSIEKAVERPKEAFHLRLVQARPKAEEWQQLSRLSNLNKLYLEDVLLDTLPRSMSGLIRMTDFRSHQNPIRYFPDTLRNWKALSYLELVGAKLDTFPKICRHWRKLREIGINKNRAERMVLPETIGSLGELKLLAINKSPLAPLPSSITELGSLRKLILKGCKLKKLPKGMGKLQSLETLVLENNKLEKIPASIGSLQNLEYLSLKGNLLKKLPESISRLSSLKRLDIRDNYFSAYRLDIIKALLPNTEILHDPIEEKKDG
ncbi:MAG: leucine-rich repeat domain-containing protein [Flavobacteriales bacterium]